MDNLFYACILFAAAAIFAVSLGSFLVGVIHVIMAKISGGKVISFKYIFFDHHYENGEAKVCIGQFTPICHFLSVNEKQQHNRKADVSLQAVCVLLYFVAAGVIVYFMCRIWKSTEGIVISLLKPVIAGIAAGFILGFISEGKVLLDKIRNDGNNLTSYWKETLRQLSLGSSLDDVRMPPYQELYRDASEEEILLYDGIRFMQKMWQRDYETLKEIAGECDSIIRHRGYDYIRVLTNVYYNMIFYYSYIERSPERAGRYYQVVKRDLEQDMDSNGRRVMAYYTYFCKGQPQEAMKMLQDGQRVLHRLSKNSFEIAYEQRLLEELEDMIRRNEGL